MCTSAAQACTSPTGGVLAWGDASPKGGKPGFVKILDDRHLLIPDIAGNKLFQSYLNMLENPRVGLVFFIPGCHDVARVNGSAETRRRTACACSSATWPLATTST